MRSATWAVIAFVVAAATAPALSDEPVRLHIGSDTVEILRDAYGVPHVFASTRRGLIYGNGYAVAQDRLGQMDMNRRVARGEMADLLGSSAIAADRETRIDGYTDEERTAQVAALPAEIREMLQAYADGVNAWISELRVAGKTLQPAGYPGKLDPATLRPWTVNDTAAIGQMMSRRWGGSEGGELRNQLVLRFLKSMQGKKAYAFFNDIAWRNDPTSPSTVPPGEDGRKWSGKTHWADPTGRVLASFDVDAARRAAEVCDQKERLALSERYGLLTKWGSYCIAVSGAKSASGAAMLVGGPQMGFRTPHISHEVHLSGVGMDVVGMGFAGVPGILIGHNRFVAWSTTTAVNDQTDIFVETLDPKNPTRYRFQGAWRQMERHEEAIRVAGGSPVTVEVFRTVHGPVVEWDKAHNLAYSRCAAYRNHELDTMLAVARFMVSRNVRDFGTACALISTGHNFLCATQDGDIGFWFCGRTPMRDPLVDPRLPTPGDGSHEWRGMVPFAQLPHIVNPRQGFLDNWNNKPAAWYDNYDTPAWGGIFHNSRIDKLLYAKQRVSAEDLRNVLLDIGTNDANADTFVPMLRSAARRHPELLGAQARRSVAMLEAWDHHATEGSVAGTIFSAWLRQVRDDLFLKPFGFITLQGRNLFDLAMQPSYILHVLLGPASPVPVQGSYTRGRSSDRVMLEALNRASAALTKQLGSDVTGWRSSRGTISFAPLAPIPATDRGTYIQIVECARPFARGFSICPPGQSELPDSPHFGDQRELAGWFFFKPMLTQRGDIATAKRWP